MRNGEGVGVIAINIEDGTVHCFRAKHTVLATRGAFLHTENVARGGKLKVSKM